MSTVPKTYNSMMSARIISADSGRHDQQTLVKMLRSRSQLFPDRLAFRFLDDGSDSSTITYGELDQSARRIAAALQERFEPGSSAAIVFPPGLGFVQAFFGCVYAGILAIPATNPKPRRPSTRLSAIVEDARPAAILTTQACSQDTLRFKGFGRAGPATMAEHR